MDPSHLSSASQALINKYSIPSTLIRHLPKRSYLPPSPLYEFMKATPHKGISVELVPNFLLYHYANFLKIQNQENTEVAINSLNIRTLSYLCQFGLLPRTPQKSIDKKSKAKNHRL
jgi:hypothetical protein